MCYLIQSIVIIYDLLNLLAEVRIFLWRKWNLEMIIFLEVLLLFFLVLLKFLVDFVFLFDKLHNFGNFSLVQYFMHGGVSKISENKRESVQQNNVDVIIAQAFGT